MDRTELLNRRDIAAARAESLRSEISRLTSRRTPADLAATEPVALAVLRRQLDKMTALVARFDAEIAG